MEKEQVTLHQINKDLLQYLCDDTIGFIIGIPFLWLVLVIGNIAIKNFFSIENRLFEILTLLFVLSEILSITYICIMYIKIKKKLFILRNDILIEKRNFKQGGTKWHSYKPYRLSFSRGHFDIPAQLSYKWSSIYSMNEKEIYNTASIGDTFTLVELNKKVIIIYNHKFFNIISTHI